MRLSPKQKVYVALLGLGAAALATDRLFLGASAPRAARAATPAARLLVNPAAAAAPTAAGLSVAEQLRKLQDRLPVDAADMPDVFHPAWRAPAVAAGKGHAPASQPATPESFRTRHALTGVLASEHGALAIVDGQAVALGQSVDGFALASVTQRAAAFEGPGGVAVTLEIEDRAPGRAARSGR